MRILISGGRVAPTDSRAHSGKVKAQLPPAALLTLTRARRPTGRVDVHRIETPMQFHIETMTCDGCARGVTKAIQRVDAAATVVADPPARQVDVVTTAPRDVIVLALTDAGFAPT